MIKQHLQTAIAELQQFIDDRPDAVTRQERTYEHSGTSISENKPITIGQGYSTIAWIPEKSGSWALPLRHERITSGESPIGKAVWQLKQVCKHFPNS